MEGALPTNYKEIQMIAANTKCTIKAAPAVLSHLIGKEAIAQENEGARGTGAQAFGLDGGGLIFGNADTGVTIEAK